MPWSCKGRLSRFSIRLWYRTIHNMLIVSELQGKLDDAIELCEKGLVIYKKTLGEDHSDVAATYNNMAILLES
jgi:hypothetical protein